MQGFYLYSKCPLGVNTTVVCQNLALKKVLKKVMGAGMGNCIKAGSKGILDAFLPSQMALETGASLGALNALKKLTYFTLQNIYKNCPKFPIGFFGCNSGC